MRKLITILFVLASFAASSQVIRANRYYVPVVVSCKILGSDTIPSFAFSFRQLNVCYYTGYCVKIRRSSDNTTSDIGFVSGYVDTAAIKTFIGSSDGFVQTGYDQSGNTRDVTQATTGKQPKIATAGVLIYSGSYIAMQFDGTDDILSRIGSSYVTFTFFGVSQRTGGAFNAIAFGQSVSTSIAALRNNNSVTQALATYNVSNAATGTANTNLNYCAGIFTPTSLFATDGSTTATTAVVSAPSYDALAVGSILRGSPIYSAGKLVEAIAYYSNRSADYTTMQANIKSYYGL